MQQLLEPDVGKDLPWPLTLLEMRQDERRPLTLAERELAPAAPAVPFSSRTSVASPRQLSPDAKTAPDFPTETVWSRRA